MFNHRLLFKNIGILFLLIWLMSACGEGEDPTPSIDGEYILEADEITSLDLNELTTQLKNDPRADVSPLIIDFLASQGVSVVKIVYKTQDPLGEEIEASGALIIPDNLQNDALSILSLQHGTITSQRDAPSNYDTSFESSFIGTLAASAGYIVVVPDYIGYGASADQPHPYEHRASLASACLDMLRASKEYLIDKGIPLSGDLFLAGYSEGGYATMSLHKYIEDQFSDEFTVTASAPGAGAYNKTAFTEFILDADEELNFINTYLWVLESYNWIYEVNLPWSFYLTEPNATAVQNGGVRVNVDRNPKDLFTEGARSGLLDGSQPVFISALADNDVFDWKPEAPTRLYHGTADDFVPFFNSQTAYDAMIANGARDVELIPFEGKDHNTALEDYLFASVQFFLSFQ